MNVCMYIHKGANEANDNVGRQWSFMVFNDFQLHYSVYIVVVIFIISTSTSPSTSVFVFFVFVFIMHSLPVVEF